MRLIWLMAMLASSAMADEWTPLAGADITQALTARVLQYQDNAQQDFFADGRTLYQTRDSSWGKWRVDYDQYCSIWPPADGWACYDVAVGANGLSIKFTDKEGSHTVGKYIDLN